MNLQELILQVNRDVDEKEGVFENEDIRDWINRGLDDLTPIARIEKKVTLTYPYLLPDDVQQVQQVVGRWNVLPRISVGESLQQGYWVWGNELFLPDRDEGPIDVYYYKQLAHLVGMEEVPEIDSPYHDLLILYAVGHLQFMDEDYAERPDALQRYQERRQQYAVFREKRNVGRASVRMKTVHGYADTPLERR